ncbi:unnamed protein product [Agarophyton chilense]
MLLSDHGDAKRTMSARTTEWRAFCEYRLEVARGGGGGTEAVDGIDLVCFVGWLSQQRKKGKRKVSSLSLPQYRSAVRTMHSKLNLPLPPTPTEYPPLPRVIKAYKKWESELFPLADVRVGMGAGLARQIWRKGMAAGTSATCVRDAAMVVFAFIFGLRESSVLHIKVEDIYVLTSHRCEVLVRFLKGRTTDEAVLRGPRSYVPPGQDEVEMPLSLVVKHLSMPGSDSQYLFSGRRPIAGWMQQRLQLLLESEGVRAPEGYCDSSHSMRLVSLTERILRGGSVVELLALYDWASSSQGGSFLKVVCDNTPAEVVPNLTSAGMPLSSPRPMTPPL